jgi:lamin B
LELAAVRRDLDETMMEFKELYDIKIALDLEIQAYRKLLEGEEQRLSISQHHTSHNLSNVDKTNSSLILNETTNRSKKRKFISNEEGEQVVSTTSPSLFTSSSTSNGAIEIPDIDFSGKSIKIQNTSASDVPINGWTLRRDVSDEQVFFKFPKGTIVKANDHVTVWSSNSGVANDPPKNILSNQKWIIGDRMITVLTDKEGNVS